MAEILSSCNSRSEIESKLADYARIGTRECWVVSSQARTVEVLQLDGTEWRDHSIRGVSEEVETTVTDQAQIACRRHHSGSIALSTPYRLETRR